MSNFPEENKIVVLTTAHMTEQDNDHLSMQSKDSSCNMVYGTEYGFIIRTYAFGDDGNYPQWAMGISTELLALIKAAKEHGAYMLELDNAAPESDEFPTFEW